MFKRILVPTDFSSYADAALRLAQNLPLGSNAQIFLVYVEAPVLANPYEYAATVPPMAEEMLTQIRKEVDKGLRRRARRVKNVTVHTDILRGEVATALIRYMKRGGMDVVVMGTHGRTGMDRLVLGSVARKVIHQAPCPVITTHARKRKWDWKHVLCPTDFSPVAHAAFGQALRLANATDASVTLLHVVRGHDLIRGAAREYHWAYRELEAVRKEEARTRLSQLSRKSKKLDIHCVTAAGHPGEEILRAAKRLKTDAVVMGTHGAGGVRKFFIGSVADRVITHAPCPVVTVRPR